MTAAQTSEAIARKPLRLWPGVVAVALQWLAWFGGPLVFSGITGGYISVLGGFLGGVVVLVWWLFFSRAPRSERWGGVLLMIVALVVTPALLHESIQGGMMGLMFAVFAVPTLSLAFVGWAVAGRRLSVGPRRATMVATILLACGAWTLVRTDGITGEGTSEFAWRWSQTPEERLLAEAGDTPAATPSAPVAPNSPEELPVARAGEEPAPPSAPSTEQTPRDQPAAQAAGEPASPPSDHAAGDTPQEQTAALAGDEATAPPPAPAPAGTGADWPGFRGRARDGVSPGVRIDIDWSRSRPAELWRRPIGPGWSSFAVRGDYLYTQEQRGDDEIVACYSTATGEPVWTHRDAVRFYESNAGAGPRATPTLSNGRVYTFGATGIVNALDAGTGALVWSRNASSDADRKVPGWGFASSPLVVDDLVIVAAAGKLVAYDLATGEPRWIGPAGGWGYSSPHLAVIDGVAQVLLLNGTGAISVAPADGAVLWEHPWPGDGIVQPALTADGDVLIGTGSGMSSGGAVGVRRVAVEKGPGGWTVMERWTSAGLKPYYNDFVVHEDHAYGFDGSLLACIDLQDGRRRWKGGRYGHGQLVLLPDEDVLLVLSEQGELALARAAPDQFTELARLPAIEGKTWNHPVAVGDLLLVRNGSEMVAFRLPLTGR